MSHEQPEPYRPGCTGKRRYRTAPDAAAHAGKLVRKPGYRALRPYRCPFCHGWHLTSRQNYQDRQP